jgi:hypothetical protein
MQENKNFDWDSIKESMKTGLVLVTFTKADKSVRVMQATLAEFLLPETIGSGVRPPNPDVITVFDLEANDWRAFRKDRVINVEIV